MWCRSVGCILAELLYRKPLFPGKDYIDQLKLIIKMLGSPCDSDLVFISSSKARAYIKALPYAQVTAQTAHVQAVSAIDPSLTRKCCASPQRNCTRSCAAAAFSSWQTEWVPLLGITKLPACLMAVVSGSVPKSRCIIQEPHWGSKILSRGCKFRE